MGENKTIKNSFSELTIRALKLVRKKLIEKEKKNNGYLVISGKDGVVKKIPAKDL